MKERSARDRKVRSTKVDGGDFKHELLNRLRSTMAVNVLKVFIRENIHTNKCLILNGYRYRAI